MIIKKQIPLLLVLLSTTGAFAQWNAAPWDNNPISVQPYDQQDVKIASDNNGGAIITWLDYRADALMTVGDIYVQRIDKNGYVKWTLNGIGICTEAAHQTAPIITEDGAGGAIVTWVDSRNGNKDVYAQRIDSTGNLLWPSGTGIPVVIKAGNQDNPRVIHDGANGGLFIWEDDSTALGDANLFVQRISAGGTILFGTGGYRVCNLAGAQINPKMIPDGSGGAVITWQDKRNGSDYDIYAQRINSSGVSQWAANGAALCLFASTQSNPKLVSDQFGGAIVSWQDKRSGIDYDIYAQYINGSGIAQWTSGGKLICNSLGAQSAIDMTGDAAINGAIITWKDGRNVNYDIYAQKIDFTGAVQWAGNGIGLCNIANDQINPNAVADGVGGAIVVWQDSALGNWDIRAQRVNSAGTLLWAAGGVDVGTCWNNQTSPKNITDGAGGSIFTWQDKRTGDFDVYAARVDAGGTLVSINQAENPGGEVVVYPNPSNGDINFRLNDKNTNGPYRLYIYDISGRELLQKEVKGSPACLISENLAAGVYSYRVESGKNIWNGKFIIEK